MLHLKAFFLSIGEVLKMCFIFVHLEEVKRAVSPQNVFHWQRYFLSFSPQKASGLRKNPLWQCLYHWPSGQLCFSPDLRTIRVQKLLGCSLSLFDIHFILVENATWANLKLSRQKSCHFDCTSIWSSLLKRQPWISSESGENSKAKMSWKCVSWIPGPHRPV